MTYAFTLQFRMKCKDCGRDLSGPFKHPDLGPLYVHPHNNSVWCDVNWGVVNDSELARRGGPAKIFNDSRSVTCRKCWAIFPTFAIFDLHKCKEKHGHNK